MLPHTRKHMALLLTTYAYCKELRPTSTSAGRVVKALEFRSSPLWGKRETHGETSHQSTPAQHEGMRVSSSKRWKR